MKRFKSSLLGLTLIFVCSLFRPAWAMPPHPDLLYKIQQGEIPETSFFKDLEELRARGVNSPTTVQLVRDIAAGSVKADFNAIAILVDFSDNIASVQASYFDTLLYQDRTGNLWFATSGGGVSRYDGMTFTTFTTKIERVISGLEPTAVRVGMMGEPLPLLRHNMGWCQIMCGQLGRIGKAISGLEPMMVVLAVMTGKPLPPLRHKMDW